MLSVCFRNSGARVRRRPHFTEGNRSDCKYLFTICSQGGIGRGLKILVPYSSSLSETVESLFYLGSITPHILDVGCACPNPPIPTDQLSSFFPPFSIWRLDRGPLLTRNLFTSLENKTFSVRPCHTL